MSKDEPVGTQEGIEEFENLHMNYSCTRALLLENHTVGFECAPWELPETLGTYVELIRDGLLAYLPGHTIVDEGHLYVQPEELTSDGFVREVWQELRPVRFWRVANKCGQHAFFLGAAARLGNRSRTSERWPTELRCLISILEEDGEQLILREFKE